MSGFVGLVAGDVGFGDSVVVFGVDTEIINYNDIIFITYKKDHPTVYFKFIFLMVVITETVEL